MANVTANECRVNEVSTGQFITRPEDLATRILEWKAAGYHVLSPAIQVSSFAPGYGVNVSFVVFDTEVDANGRGLDVYYDKRTMAVTERAPAKIGLSRLAAAAGVSWVGAQSGRRDPLTIQNYWLYQVVGVYLAFDGTPQTIQGEKEIDYRNGSSQIGEWTPEAWAEALARKQTAINGWSDNRVRTARMNGAERAETGAWERAMRGGFGIKHVYSIAELRKPFVCLRFSPLVDMSDATVRALVTQRQLDGVAALYAGTARQLPMRSAEIVDIASRRQEPVSVGASVTPAAAAAPQSSAVERQPDPAPNTERNPSPVSSSASPQVELPPERNSQLPTPNGPFVSGPKPTPANYVREVKSEPKKARSTGNAFMKYRVIDGNGAEHVTIKESIAKKAFDARDSQLPVVIHSALNSFREHEISDITPFAAPQGDFKL